MTNFCVLTQTSRKFG